MAASRPRFSVASTHASVAEELMGTAPAAAVPSPFPGPSQVPPPATEQQVQRPDQDQPRQDQPRQDQPGEAPPAAPKNSKAKNEPFRVMLPPELIARLRGTVAALQYRDQDWNSLTRATEVALARLVAEAEQAYNNGQPFPWDPDRHLAPGRRFGH